MPLLDRDHPLSRCPDPGGESPLVQPQRVPALPNGSSHVSRSDNPQENLL